MKYDYYNKNLQAFAKKNKRSMTKAEACLWKYALSKKQMLGYSFRRQRPISQFIVDFMCLELKLVIEVDGYSHFLRENEVKDKIRQERIEGLGYKILRFKDAEVLNQMSLVKSIIQRQIDIIVGSE